MKRLDYVLEQMLADAGPRKLSSEEVAALKVALKLMRSKVKR